jgi:hypothetical protein
MSLPYTGSSLSEINPLKVLLLCRYEAYAEGNSTTSANRHIVDYKVRASACVMVVLYSN